VRLLLDSEGCHLLPGGLRPAVPRMRQAGAPTPGTHFGKTRFNHGTVGMGEIPVDAPNRGARSRSTRRCERPLDATRSILTDGAIRVGAKRAFFASSRDARRVLASAPREETDASPSKFFSPALGNRPPPRCTRRIRWRGDTSAHGYVILVRMAQQRCVGVRADNIFFARVCRGGEPIKSRGLTTLGWLVQKRKRDVPVRLRCPSPRGVTFPSNTSYRLLTTRDLNSLPLRAGFLRTGPRGSLRAVRRVDPVCEWEARGQERAAEGSVEELQPAGRTGGRARRDI